MDFGDNVVIVNAKDVVLTGKKWRQKTYYKHTCYPGGFKTKNAEMVHMHNKTEVLRKAINGMLPHNLQRKRRMARCYIYADATHPFGAQKPILREPLGRDAVFKELDY
jgi:large subunit ribosomal protein L13